MTGPGRNRLLSALLISALAFFLITGSSLFSVDAGTPAEEKKEGKDALTVGKDTLKVGRWYDDFKKNVEDGTPAKDNKDLGGWAVPVSWLKEQIAQYERMAIREQLLQEQGVEAADPGKYEYFVFVVTKDKKPQQDFKKEKIVDPAKHGLWIRGFRNPESFAEDFPPIQWP